MKIFKKLNENNEVIYTNENGEAFEFVDETKDNEKENLTKELNELKEKYNLSEQELKDLKEIKKQMKQEAKELQSQLNESKLKAEFINQGGNLSAFEAFKKVVGDNIPTDQLSSFVAQGKSIHGYFFNSSPNHSPSNSEISNEDIENSGSFYK